MTKMPEPVAYSVLDRRTGKHWYTHESKYTAQGYASHYAHRDADGPSQVVLPLITTTQAEAYADQRVREATEWQPIETAPKDGTYILLTNPESGGSWVGHYQEFSSGGLRFDPPWHSMMLNCDHLPKKWASRRPTHWMPLPVLPKEQSK